MNAAALAAVANAASVTNAADDDPLAPQVDPAEVADVAEVVYADDSTDAAAVAETADVEPAVAAVVVLQQRAGGDGAPGDEMHRVRALQYVVELSPPIIVFLGIRILTRVNRNTRKLLGRGSRSFCASDVN
eukprot:4599759-Prymnesium_polylepis.1